MQRSPVESKLLKSVGYDATTKTLEVEFHSGKVYEYANVKQETFDEMLAAKSLGSFFLHQVKPVHSCKRIEEKDAKAQDASTPEGGWPDPQDAPEASEGDFND